MVVVGYVSLGKRIAAQPDVQPSTGVRRVGLADDAGDAFLVEANV